MNLSTAQTVKAALDKVWPLIDPSSRTFGIALGDALARASAGSWPAGDVVAIADARALAIGTQLYFEVLKDRQNDPYSDRWGAALIRTSRLLAERTGYKGESVDDLKAGAKGTAAFPVIEVVAIVLGLVAVTAIAIWLITKAANVVSDELARREDERNLVRLQSQAEKVIDSHVSREETQGPLAWSPAELSVLESLESMQKMIVSRGGAQGTGSEGLAFGGGFIVAGLAAAAAVYYFFFRKAAA